MDSCTVNEIEINHLFVKSNKQTNKQSCSTNKYLPVCMQDPTFPWYSMADRPHTTHVLLKYTDGPSQANKQTKRHSTLSLRRALKILIFSMVDSMWLPLAV